ncbi:FAD-dependent oxidoreductase [Mycobacterium kubicae]|uniref:ferredoxin--NADP(+) reductase n=2 Tax=Mycobacterium kubicae TaxID=120959 RepID=A0AAX1J9F8_9MYCO|nr:FAD-dependent oxidoreductase [Mycobacterium kubicae]ORV94437.1 ferredoxin [Mycobacterium kubicae]QNI13560.1 4Fe-4S dicluster domain-containing protein [Mycobacterium kubicae]QPI37077.1 FAD-dependent oxidoreductase [Mycobacterium kubicae]
MPHVITQSCCNDGSCVFACPVNCIHPSPDEPGFATSEMLYIDPAACVDCGACVSACPVGAIAPDSRLDTKQLPFVEINASFYPERPADVKLPPTSKLAPVLPAPQVRARRQPLTVAIVGSGPAAMYAADELLTQQGVRVNVFEKLPTPYGLVRAGVAPDHQNTKRVTRLFDRVSRHRRFRFYLNVEVGKHLSHAELMAHHHAVLYAVGAPDDRRLDIDGMGLPGTGTATELVAWINGHPDFAGLPVDLSHERVVIVGNGNVALDVARLLTADPDALARTDIADHALRAFRKSAVREVVIAARRGPAHSAFTLPELIGLTCSSDVVLDAADRRRVIDALATASDPLVKRKLEILSTLGDGSAPATRPRIRLAYQLTPRRVLGQDRASAVEFTVTGTDDVHRLDAGLVLTSIGYRGKALRDLPFDEAAAVVPNDAGRVVDPSTQRPVTGAYVAGWIKRGPTGFIGTNKSCSLQTVAALVDDFNAGQLTDPVAKPSALDHLIGTRQPEVVDSGGWQAIDAAEIASGSREHRPRKKFTDIGDMLAVAATAPQQATPLGRRLLARLRASS